MTSSTTICTRDQVLPAGCSPAGLSQVENWCSAGGLFLRSKRQQNLQQDPSFYSSLFPHDVSYEVVLQPNLSYEFDRDFLMSVSEGRPEYLRVYLFTDAAFSATSLNTYSIMLGLAELIRDVSDINLSLIYSAGGRMCRAARPHPPARRWSCTATAPVFTSPSYRFQPRGSKLSSTVIRTVSTTL